MTRFPRLLAVVVLLACVSDANGQLRIVSYNTANGEQNQQDPRPGMGAILQAIGAETVNGIAKPIDVLALQEQFSSATTTQAIVEVLDALYGTGTYARATLDGNTLGAGRPGLIYNTQTVTLLDQTALGSVNGSAQARATLRYQLRPVGYDAGADFYIYSDHYKASTSSSDRARRRIEANSVRADADALGPGASIIFAGDYNIRGSFEEPVPGSYESSNYSILLAAGGPGQAVDPLDPDGAWIATPVAWHNNSALRLTHTQAPAFNPPSPLVGGGVDDRFDFQLTSAELLDREGMSYIGAGPGGLVDSYRAFGNNGTHRCCNSPITTGSGAAPELLVNLTEVSDHLPVVADYRLPAKMAVTVTPSASTVLVGAGAAVILSIQNTAPVVAVIGADELDYDFSGSGALSGSGSGTDFALGTADIQVLSFDTSAVGLASGQVSVTSSSQSVAGGAFSQQIDLTVLDHAGGSFDAAVEQSVLLVDLGNVEVGSGPRSLAVSLFNRETTAGLTAALDLDTLAGSGATGVLTTDLAPFSGLAAGAEYPFLVQANPTTAGWFSATYTLTVSDEDLPGETAGVELTLALAALAFRRGDMDGDDDTDFDDIDGFVLGLSNPAAYEDQFGLPPAVRGDFDLDDDHDFDDIPGFVALLTGGAAAGRPGHAVPEPATSWLLLLGLLAGWWSRRSRLSCRMPYYHSTLAEPVAPGTRRGRWVAGVRLPEQTRHLRQ